MTTPTRNTFDVAGRGILITGASQGLGANFARTLAAHGAKLVLAARQVAKLEALQAEIEAAGGGAATVAMDVTSGAAAIDAAIAETAEKLGGRIDVLINNAGIAVSKPFLKLTEEDWDATVDTNLKGAFLVAQAVAKRMVETGGGSIVNIASVLGTEVMGNLVPYCASKAGVNHMTRAMALELARYNIRVNAIAPGYIETDINASFFETEGGQKLLRKVAQRKLGAAVDLDGALLLLSSDASAFMTGSVVTVDGGFGLA